MKSLIYYILIFITSTVFAQNADVKQVDSIFQNFEQAYKSATSDAEKLRSLIDLGRYHVYRETEESLEKLEEAHNLFQSSTSKLDSTNLGNIYRLYGVAYRRLGNMKEALSYNHKANDVFLQFKDSFNLGRINQNLAVMYRSLREYDKSILYGKKAINLNKGIGRLKGLGYNYNNVAQAFLMLKEEDSAIQYFMKARDYFSQVNFSRGVNRVNACYAGILLTKGAYQEAQGLYLKALTYYEVINYKQDILNLSLLIAETYIGLKEYKNAEKYIEKALTIAKEEKFKANLSNVYKAKARALEAANRYKEAYKNIILYHKYRDSVINLDNIKKIQEIELTYEFRKEKVKDSLQLVKKREIAETNTELLKKESKIKSQWMLFGGIGLLAIFTILYLLRSNTFAKKQQELQTQFSQDLINGQEQERVHLARELHDSVGQKLMLLTKTTKNIGHENATNLASSTLEEIRSISRGLHPSNLERLGLTEAINALIYDFNANTELFFTEEIDNIDNTLSKESELHVYRIIQESLSNIVKHSEAKAVKMEIQKEENSINISVSDNGIGFNFESKYKNMSLGLKTLLERAKIIGAQIHFDSTISKGTIMKLTLSY